MKRHRYGHGTTEEHGNLSRLLCATLYAQKRTKGCLSREGRLACVCVHPLPDNRKVNRRTCTTQTLSSSKLVDIERERERGGAEALVCFIRCNFIIDNRGRRANLDACWTTHNRGNFVFEDCRMWGQAIQDNYPREDVFT